MSFLPPPSQLEALDKASNASGSCGCGAWHGTKWFQLKWDEYALSLPIVVKELLAIILAAAMWGPLWESSLVHCHVTTRQ